MYPEVEADAEAEADERLSVRRWWWLLLLLSNHGTGCGDGAVFITVEDSEKDGSSASY